MPYYFAKPHIEKIAKMTEIEQKKKRSLAITAIELMEMRSIVPTPENYAVWFAYAQANNKNLNHEIDSIIEANLPFSADTNAYLYQKYVVANRDQRVLDDSALNAQKIMLEALRILNEFGGETKNYNQDLDKYVEKVSNEIGGDESVKKIFKEFIDTTVSLRKSGEVISTKLEESTKEINNLRKDLQQVTVEAQRDFLTGLFNRKTFDRLISEQMLIATEQNAPLSLLMIDVDHFKQFNDKFGHLLGDEVLKIVSRALLDSLKGRDVVARFGGEEFVVFLPDTPLQGAARVAELVRSTIARKELKRRDTGEIYGTITVSIGVSVFRAGKDSLPTLIKRADDALYEAKNSGRNRVAFEKQ